MEPVVFEMLQMENNGGYLKRARIPGGWLVVYLMDTPVQYPDRVEWHLTWNPAMTFVPDPQHLWGKPVGSPEGYGNGLGEV